MIFFKQSILLLGITLFSQQLLAQSVGVGTTSPNNNAALHIVAPNNNQGILIPSMSLEQRTDVSFINNLSSQDNGLIVYDLTENRFYYWIDEGWVQVLSGAINRILEAGTGIAINEQSQIVNIGDADSTNDITTSTIAGGVLAGNYPNPQLAEGAVETTNLADLAVTGAKVADNAVGVEKLSGLTDPTSGRNSLLITSNSNIPRWFQPSINQVLVTDNAGQITSRPETEFERENLPTGHIYVGDDNQATPVDASGNGRILVGDGGTLVSLDASGNGRVLVGNGTSLVSVDVMGDITIDGTGATQINADAVGANEIADGSVATAELAIQAVTTDKIAQNAVQSAQILDASITTDDLANGIIDSDKLADGAITNNDINSGAEIMVSKLEPLGTGQIIFGTADGTPTIGSLSGDASINASGELTLGTTSTIDIDGGTIDNASIGSTTPATGSFTSLIATDGSMVAALNASNLTSGTIADARLPTLITAGTTGGGGNFIESITVDAQGRVTAVMANSVPPSDIRLKENIVQLAYSPQNLNQLKAYQYQWKDNKMGQGNQIGLLAQEVEKVYPELVKERLDGYKGVLYQGFIPILIEATKAQQDSLVSLQKENTGLQQQVLQLNGKLQRYEQRLSQLEKIIQKAIVSEPPSVVKSEAQ
ncbi:MAG: tail fiber domain-containing protein [Bacteroidota bacterium]